MDKDIGQPFQFKPPHMGLLRRIARKEVLKHLKLLQGKTTRRKKQS